MKRAIRNISVLAVYGSVACASGGTSAGESGEQALPLSSYTQRAVLVLPLQHVSEPGGSTNSQSESARAFRDAMNYEIQFAFGESAPARWIFAPRIIQSSKRNIGLSADPQKLAVEQLAEKLPDPGDPLSETLRTQVRQIVALTDARYLLLPVFVRFAETAQNGMYRATMRVVLVDSRLAQVRWAADIVTEPAPMVGRAAAASLSSRLAVLAGLR